ncbi:MAG: patatin-like phospholipase family protein [Ectothiorhodospiraceae bacterium]|nr:patatin-like phospholipase family protein [Ectothiorhodospiraceae bacterium]MCH8504910.1 patatin-like phospholipase family protein [Ectothiorhodospiraceae bacterium]
MVARECARSLDLALQGGGSHGAFTWGVLDRLLEQDDVDFGGVSGTSAGAMNAVVLATGWARGGREGAREALREFWLDVGRAAEGPLPGTSASQMLFGHMAPSFVPFYRFFDAVSRFISPYQSNPLNLNPLRDLVARHADFAAIAGLEDLRVFVCATNVHTGQQRVFRNHEVSCDVVLASACLPLLFHAVEIDGDAYWDGGYSSNPALLPLIKECRQGDLMLVQINPLTRAETPRSADKIVDRISEISFNNSLHQELRTVALIKRLLDEEEASGHSYTGELFRKIHGLNLHRIEGAKEMSGFETITRLTARVQFLEQLHDIGYRCADGWLEEHSVDIGRRSTLDLAGEYGEFIQGA